MAQRSMLQRHWRSHWRRSRAGLLMGVWIVFTLFCVGFCGASLVARYHLLLHPAADLRAELASLGISPAFHAAYNIALESLVVASYVGMAALIAWRKPQTPPRSRWRWRSSRLAQGLPGTIYAILNDQPIWEQPYGFLQILGWMTAAHLRVRVSQWAIRATLDAAAGGSLGGVGRRLLPLCRGHRAAHPGRLAAPSRSGRPGSWWARARNTTAISGSRPGSSASRPSGLSSASWGCCWASL